MLVPGAEGNTISFRRSSGGKGITLPCGRCIGCRLERSRQWAVRIMHEAKMHDENSFVTLTYDDEHLPKDGSLSVVAVQNFMKRLRDLLAPKRIRFFLCGEYGDKGQRPHYHAIIFGHGFPDKVTLRGKGKFQLFTSALLEKAWPHGFCSVGDVSFESASYVANYATKKITNKNSYVDSTGVYRPSQKEYYGNRKPEFLVMSRRPGIGRAWYECFRGDVYPSDEVIVRGESCRPPRYYDNIEKERNPESFANTKKNREEAAQVAEEVRNRGGSIVAVTPGCNRLRLRDREAVAEAKAKLKSRNL